VSPYVWDSNLCEIKDTFPALALVIDSMEVKEKPWDLCCSLNSTAVFATKRVCCNTERLA